MVRKSLIEHMKGTDALLEPLKDDEVGMPPIGQRDFAVSLPDEPYLLEVIDGKRVG
jgi:hypothetical protein